MPSFPEGVEELNLHEIEEYYIPLIGESIWFHTTNSQYRHLNGIVHVRHVNGSGAIAIEEYSSDSHFVRRCFHRIIGNFKEETTDDTTFYEVFA